MGIDLGSNYIKYAIVDTVTRKVVYTDSVYYRLGKSLDDKNNIPKEKIEEVVNLINEWKSIAQKYNVININAVGTAGLRKANNSEELINEVYNTTGIKIRIISGVEEANTNWLGALLSFDERNNSNINNTYVVIDIGGMSTEVSIGTKNNIKKSRSINIGTASLSNIFKTTNRVIDDDNEVTGILHYIDNAFKNVNMPNIDTNNTIFVLTGSSGYTVLQSTSNIKIGLRSAKPLYQLTFDKVEQALSNVRANPNISNVTDKEICFAQVILIYYFMKKFNINTINFSTTTLKEGLALDEKK